MNKTIKWVGLILVVAIAAYVLHVPILQFISKFEGHPDLSKYVPISADIESESFVLEPAFIGSVNHILYDPTHAQYLIIGHLLEQPDEGFSHWHIMTLGQDGEVLDVQGISAEAVIRIAERRSFETVFSVRERPSNTSYSFAAEAPEIELEHYVFEELARPPYLFYNIPIIDADWRGTAFVNITHEGEEFNLYLPADFDSKNAFTDKNVEGLLYYHSREGETLGVAFLEVGELGFSRRMGGGETHRVGYGVHVIRPK